MNFSVTDLYQTFRINFLMVVVTLQTPPNLYFTGYNEISPGWWSTVNTIFFLIVNWGLFAVIPDRLLRIEITATSALPDIYLVPSCVSPVWQWEACNYCFRSERQEFCMFDWVLINLKAELVICFSHWILLSPINVCGQI